MYAVKIDPKNPDKGVIAKAAAVLKKGGLVVFPTETVYGIAANLEDDKAVARLYDVKNRPENKPFTVHISDLNMLEKMGCKVTPEARLLIKKFWPGPLTIILKSGKDKTTGFRMPSNRIAIELIKSAGVPIIAPSANLSGKAAPVSAEEAMKDLEGRVDVVLDAGKTDVGIESTVIDMTVTPPAILREGAIRKEEIEKALAFSG